MKIYPAKQTIKSKKQISYKDIPLAYVEKTDGDFKSFLSVNTEFQRSDRTAVVKPYQRINSTNILFFDTDGKAIEDSAKYLKRIGNETIALPINSAEFIPDTFTYSVLIQKNDTFNYNTEYRINVCSNEETIAKKLIPVFSTPSMYGICPKNIIINENDIMPKIITDDNYTDMDYCFINASSLTSSITLDDIISQHTNVWIFGDDFGTLLTYSDEIDNSLYKYNNYQIYTDSLRTMEDYANDKNQYAIFNTSGEWSKASKSQYSYINLFSIGCPVLVAKKENGGFVVLSHSSFLSNIEKYTEILYEVLLYTYLNGYFQTEQKTSFITDKNIDYFINMEQRYFYKHPRINLKQLLSERKYNQAIKYKIANVICSSNVAYFGCNKYDDLLFNKISHLADPDKNIDDISIYTTKGTVILCSKTDNRINLIEDRLMIAQQNLEKEVIINISPFRSSGHSIDFEQYQTITVKDPGAYYLIFDNNYKKFAFILKDKYRNTDGVIFAYLNVERNDNIDYVDIRQVGGGDTSTTNYEMIDTGNINGRPYRIGSIMLIRLPKRFQDVDKNINVELNKHIASGDYPIIIYE